MATLTAVAVWLMAVPASAAEIAGFYRGAIEAGRQKLEVGLELLVEASAVSGSYFYVGKKAGDISIEGTMGPEGTVRFDELDEQRRITGVWAGRLAGGTISGTWRNPRTGKSWPFRLTAQEARGRYVTEPVEVKDASSLGPLVYRMAEAPVTGHRVPQITRFAERGVMNAINRYLMSQARAATCGHEPDDHELTAEAAYTGQDILSVRIRESWFCGAAYPTTDADTSLTFDLRTGQPMDMASLFREDVAGNAIDEVLYAYQLAQVRPRIKQWCAKQADLMDDKRLLEDEACMEDFETSMSEDDPDFCLLQFRPRHLAQSGSTFHFAADGLVVRPDWPHVIAGCAQEVTVPYRALAGLAAPGKALARVAAAHQDAPLRYRIHPSGARREQDVVYTPDR